MALADVISMPDEWEYPWFAAWDTAFHTIPLAHVDPAFAKEQLVLMCREWAMHPNGQLPAYEWAFGDVNPPVHAWAAWHVYRIDGYRDQAFLIRVFTKLLLNFSWWVNRKDADGSNVFEGGFLGMDNIALFDRSAPLPPGYRLEQSDATSWMAFYCQQMFKIALELSRFDQAWDDTATKFLEHFLSIAEALNAFGSHGVSLWHEEDGFFYDVLVPPDGGAQPLRIRSMVGLLPILGATEVPTWITSECPDLTTRLRWLQRRRPGLMGPLRSRSAPEGRRMLLSLVDEERLARAPGADVRQRRVPLALRHPVAVEGDRVGRGPRRRAGRRHRVRAGGVAHRAVRRQLQLARPGVVPGQRAARRQAAHAGPALRRLVHHRDPHRLGQPVHAGRRRRPDRQQPDGALPPRGRKAPG